MGPFRSISSLVEHGHPGVDAPAIRTNLTSRRLHVPVVIVAEWDEDLAVAVLKLGASDYVSRSRASLRAVYFRLHRLMAHAALLAEQSAAPDAGRAAVD
jgi:DNA-binding NarL/FixJ family response regulator